MSSFYLELITRQPSWAPFCVDYDSLKRALSEFMEPEVERKNDRENSATSLNKVSCADVTNTEQCVCQTQVSPESSMSINRNIVHVSLIECVACLETQVEKVVQFAIQEQDVLMQGLQNMQRDQNLSREITTDVFSASSKIERHSLEVRQDFYQVGEQLLQILRFVEINLTMINELMVLHYMLLKRIQLHGVIMKADVIFSRMLQIFSSLEPILFCDEIETSFSSTRALANCCRAFEKSFCGNDVTVDSLFDCKTRTGFVETKYEEAETQSISSSDDIFPLEVQVDTSDIGDTAILHAPLPCLNVNTSRNNGIWDANNSVSENIHSFVPPQSELFNKLYAAWSAWRKVTQDLMVQFKALESAALLTEINFTAIERQRQYKQWVSRQLMVTSTFLYMANHAALASTAVSYVHKLLLDGGVILGTDYTYDMVLGGSQHRPVNSLIIALVLLILGPFCSQFAHLPYTRWWIDMRFIDKNNETDDHAARYCAKTALIFSSVRSIVGNALYAVGLPSGCLELAVLGRVFIGLGIARSINRWYVEGAVKDDNDTSTIASRASACITAGAMGVLAGDGLSSICEASISFVDLGAFKQLWQAENSSGWVMAAIWMAYLYCIFNYFENPSVQCNRVVYKDMDINSKKLLLTVTNKDHSSTTVGDEDVEPPIWQNVAVVSSFILSALPNLLLECFMSLNGTMDAAAIDWPGAFLSTCSDVMGLFMLPANLDITSTYCSEVPDEVEILTQESAEDCIKAHENIDSIANSFILPAKLDIASVNCGEMPDKVEILTQESVEDCVKTHETINLLSGTPGNLMVRDIDTEDAHSDPTLCIASVDKVVLVDLADIPKPCAVDLGQNLLQAVSSSQTSFYPYDTDRNKSDVCQTAILNGCDKVMLTSNNCQVQIDVARVVDQSIEAPQDEVKEVNAIITPANETLKKQQIECDNGLNTNEFKKNNILFDLLKNEILDDPKVSYSVGAVNPAIGVLEQGLVSSKWRPYWEERTKRYMLKHKPTLRQCSGVPVKSVVAQANGSLHCRRSEKISIRNQFSSFIKAKVSKRTKQVSLNSVNEHASSKVYAMIKNFEKGSRVQTAGSCLCDGDEAVSTKDVYSSLIHVKPPFIVEMEQIPGTLTHDSFDCTESSSNMLKQSGRPSGSSTKDVEKVGCFALKRNAEVGCPPDVSSVEIGRIDDGKRPCVSSVDIKETTDQIQITNSESACSTLFATLNASNDIEVASKIDPKSTIMLDMDARPYENNTVPIAVETSVTFSFDDKDMSFEAIECIASISPLKEFHYANGFIDNISMVKNDVLIGESNLMNLVEYGKGPTNDAQKMSLLKVMQKGDEPDDIQLQNHSLKSLQTISANAKSNRSFEVMKAEEDLGHSIYHQPLETKEARLEGPTKRLNGLTMQNAYGSKNVSDEEFCDSVSGKVVCNDGKDDTCTAETRSKETKKINLARMLNCPEQQHDSIKRKIGARRLTREHDNRCGKQPSSIDYETPQHSFDESASYIDVGSNSSSVASAVTTVSSPAMLNKNDVPKSPYITNTHHEEAEQSSVLQDCTDTPRVVVSDKNIQFERKKSLWSSFRSARSFEVAPRAPPTPEFTDLYANSLHTQSASPARSAALVFRKTLRNSFRRRKSTPQSPSGESSTGSLSSARSLPFRRVKKECLKKQLWVDHTHGTLYSTGNDCLEVERTVKNNSPAARMRHPKHHPQESSQCATHII